MIKVCGFTDVDELAACLPSLPDAIGLVFYPFSRHFVPIDQALRLRRMVPIEILTIGVWLLPTDPFQIVREAVHLSLDGIQLHGPFGRDLVMFLRENLPHCIVIGAVGMDAATAEPNRSAREIDALGLDYVLLDTGPGTGGTGKPWPWDRLTAGIFRTPTILAGGLNADNVEKAVRLVRPAGVDVSSGVERQGKKDPDLVRQFVLAARTALNEYRHQYGYQGASRR